MNVFYGNKNNIGGFLRVSVEVLGLYIFSAIILKVLLIYMELLRLYFGPMSFHIAQSIKLIKSNLTIYLYYE